MQIHQFLLEGVVCLDIYICVCVCVSVLTPVETDREQEESTDTQAGKTALLWQCRTAAAFFFFYKMMFLSVFPPSERRRRAEGRFIQLHTDAMVLLIFDMLWLWQLPRLLLETAFFSPRSKARISTENSAMGVKYLLVTVALHFILVLLMSFFRCCRYFIPVVRFACAREVLHETQWQNLF